MILKVDPKKHLILVRQKSNPVFRDQTNELSSVLPEGDRTRITYKKNGSTYPFLSSNILILKDPVQLPVDDQIIFYKGQEMKGVTKALKFEKYVRTFVGKKIITDRASAFLFDENCLSDEKINAVFNYFKEISSVLKSPDFPQSFLTNQLNSIDHLSDQSVLASYLKGQQRETNEKCESLIYPFGINLSQRRAVERAFQHQLSVIKGPPGTGKTQTILNIVTNIVLNKKTVAVVSGNNSATDNVYEKLIAHELDFLTAPLGNRQKQTEFFDRPQPFKSVPKTWIDNPKEDLDENVAKFDEKLKTATILLQKQIEQVQLKGQLNQLEVEYRHFKSSIRNKDHSQIPARNKQIANWNSRKIIRLLADLEMIMHTPKTREYLRRITIFLRYGILQIPKKGSNLFEYTTTLQAHFYLTSIQEHKKRIRKIEGELKTKKLEDILKDIQYSSERLLRAKLAQRFNKDSNRIFSSGDVRGNSDTFLNRFPVVLSTTHSARNCINKHNLFDYIIIDEASQVDLVTASIAMSCCKNIIIVGDNSQLPQIVDKKVQERNKELRSQFSIDDAFDYTKNNILESLSKLFGESIPSTLLKEHYRCHPQIIEFCNQKYYAGDLRIMKHGSPKDTPLMIMQTSEGHHEKRKNGSWINQRQVDVTRDEVISKLNVSPDQIGVITPYRGQANLLSELIGNSQILCDTVHKFQGREKEVIILNTVNSKPDEFNDNPNLINVAVSRAISKLIVVVPHSFQCLHGSNIGDLIRYIKYTAGEDVVGKSDIISIFDCLYSEYSKHLEPMLKRMKSVSRYKSENLMNELIGSLLEKDRFGPLEVKLHYPLSKLVKPSEGISSREREFLLHPFTHVDFVIFNRLNKEPLLVIEVDGFHYHQNSYTGEDLTKQKFRDSMKDKLLSEGGLKLLRFSTVQSGETDRLEFALKQCCECRNKKDLCPYSATSDEPNMINEKH